MSSGRARGRGHRPHERKDLVRHPGGAPRHTSSLDLRPSLGGALPADRRCWLARLAPQWGGAAGPPMGLAIAVQRTLDASLFWLA